jgi:hypothetical protein
MSAYRLDPFYGIGAVSLNANTARAQIELRPSMFLNLAHRLDANSECALRIIPYIRTRLQSRGIGYPILHIAPPLEWRNNDFSKPCQVIESNGRHRMHAIMEVQGDEPIPVLLVPWQDITQQELNTWLPRMREQMLSQDGELVSSQLWDQTHES